LVCSAQIGKSSRTSPRPSPEGKGGKPELPPFPSGEAGERFFILRIGIDFAPGLSYKYNESAFMKEFTAIVS
jgi:hypothetical protein